MKKTACLLLGAALFFGSTSFALAAEVTGVDGVGPQPFSVTCDPYTTPFVNDQAYIPSVPGDNGTCVFNVPQTETPQFIAIYQGTRGDALLLFSDFGTSNSGDGEFDMAYTQFGTLSATPPQPDDAFFAVSVGGDDPNDANNYFENSASDPTLTPPTDYSIVNWYWGAPITVTADNQTINVGDPLPTFYATLSGFVGGDTLATSGITGTTTCSLDPEKPDVDTNKAGVYTDYIVCNQGTASSTKYSFAPPVATYVAGTLTINPAPAPSTATANITVAPYSVTYDGNAHTATVVAMGVNGENLNADVNLTGTAHTAAGDYSDAWTFHDPTGTYADANGTVSDSIAKANATITVTPYSVTYDGSAHTAVGTATGVQSESLSGLDLSGTTHTAVGTYATDAWTFHNPNGNYSDAGSTVHDSIAQAGSVTTVSCPASVIYSGVAQTPCTATVTGVGGLNQTLTVNYANNTNTGTAYASASFAGDSNDMGSSDSEEFAVTTAPLTVTANSQTVYGASIPALSATLSGFLGTDTQTNSTSGTPSCTTTATNASPAETYPITCTAGTLTSTNYSFSKFVPGTLTIPTLACMWALNTSATDLQMSSSGSIKGVGCGMQINSNSTSAVTLSGSGGINTASNCIVGSVKNTGSASVSPTPLSNCISKNDPLSSITKPTVPSTCNFTNYSLTNSSAVTLQPGVYCGGMKFSGSGAVTFSPGIYILKNGPLSVSGSSPLTGNGVSFFLTGTNAAIAASGSGPWHLVAPMSGLLAGCVFYLDGSSLGISATSQFSGSSNLYLEGVVYLPKQALQFSGSSMTSAASPFTAFVADTFKMSGSGVLTLNGSASQTVVPVPIGLYVTN